MDATDRIQCLPGTREDLIEYIMSWATSPSADSEHQVLWIHGPGGSGKSTLSSTIAQLLSEKNYLGAFVFFDRKYPQMSRPANVIRTLACQLSSARPGIAAAISTVVEEMPSIRFSPITLQFQQLLVQPLISEEALGANVPLVLVLDAFDECGAAKDRRELLELLAERSASLPLDIRIIITSRPQKDIREAFEHQPHVLVQQLHIESDVNFKDISSYFRYRLKMVGKQRPLMVGVDWPGDDEIAKLTKRTSGLFAWALAASGFINDYNPRIRIDDLLKRSLIPDAEAALDFLYKMILCSVCNWNENPQDFVTDFRAIAGMVLVARMPLSTDAIDSLLVPPHCPSKDTLEFLGCVISSEPTVRVLHSSFIEFLSNPARCGDIWHVNPPTFHRSLAIRCLNRLDYALKDNICGLSSSLDNMATNLLKDIEYECAFWIEHVVAVEVDVLSLAEHIEPFLHRHLLHWFEAMSILQRSRETILSLGHLLDWIEVSCLSSRHRLCCLLTKLFTSTFLVRWFLMSGRVSVYFVRDAYRFARVFADAIEEYPLLVYEMASSYTPTNSPIYQTHCDISPLPHTAGGTRQFWPPLRLVPISFHAQEDLWVGMHSVSFSPDGKWIAAGSADKTVRVWDANSGAEVLPALRGHLDDVRSVAFSPEGKYIASGSEDKTVRLWDTSLGIEVLPEMRGHDGCVQSVAFSPDGTRIVSGSTDFTAYVWNLIPKAEPPLIFLGHDGRVNSVAFSPNGTCIASGSDDTTIRVWDATSGGEVVPAFWHEGEVTSLAFSPDGRYIVSGSFDTAIRIWNADTAELVSILPCKV